MKHKKTQETVGNCQNMDPLWARKSQSTVHPKNVRKRDIFHDALFITSPLRFVDVFGRTSFPKRTQKRHFPDPRSHSKGPNHALEKRSPPAKHPVCKRQGNKSRRKKKGGVEAVSISSRQQEIQGWPHSISDIELETEVQIRFLATAITCSSCASVSG